MPDKDIDELKKLNAELEKSRAEFEKLSHFKSHLLTFASHQIKAPLGAIKGYIQLLEEGHYGEVNDRVKEVFSKIKFAADDLIGTIENLIDIRKIEEGKMAYEMKEFDIRAVAEEEFSSLRSIATSRKLEFAFSAEGKEFIIKGDARHLKHVMQNLIENALKYTPKGFVKVLLKEDKENITFSVTDSGIGISKGVMPLIFEEFVRDERVKQEIRGSGVGLHVAKSIIEDHGGKIWMFSEGENQGSIFSFSLPKK